MRYTQTDLTRVTTYPLASRRNLVQYNDLVRPGETPIPFEHKDLDAVARRIVDARDRDRQVIWMMGAHVIKSGLSPILIELVKRGLVTHVAGNGAVSIHDFELALIGETSEDVADGIEAGTFGMADETGRHMHRALRIGARDGLGYGTALGRYIDQNPELFAHRESSVLYTAYTTGVPATIHITIGADIIHQHPDADFAILGAASGTDFKIFTASISNLREGVFLNFGSAVTGPEVFLKALTISRNLRSPVSGFCTANFDLMPLKGDYHADVEKDDPEYYYRPRKNIVNRPPAALAGTGYHINGDHRATIPALHNRIVEAADGLPIHAPPAAPEVIGTPAGPSQLPAGLQKVIAGMQARHPELEPVVPDLVRAFRAIAASLKTGGTVFLCGNGGSMADALHISGEMLKSYAHPRTLDPALRRRIERGPDGERLIRNLEPGLRAVVLGVNASLASAVSNDMPDRDMGAAQELLALGKPGDILLGISTSGNARNVVYSAEAASALDMTVIAMTGEDGGKLAEAADIPLRAPAGRTDRAQEQHVCLYHALCEMLELHFFDGGEK